MKVHFGGSIKLPWHGSVWPIFRSHFFFCPTSGATGRLRPAGGRSAVRSAPPPRGGEGGRDSVVFRFPLGSLAESPPGPRLGPGALELPPPPGPLARLPPAVAPLLPAPTAPPPALLRRDRSPSVPTADITARILSRSRLLQREGFRLGSMFAWRSPDPAPAESPSSRPPHPSPNAHPHECAWDRWVQYTSTLRGIALGEARCGGRSNHQRPSPP